MLSQVLQLHSLDTATERVQYKGAGKLPAPPEYWGKFCYSVPGLDNVQEINLIKIYQMAKEMVSLSHLRTGTPANETWFALCSVHTWLESFLSETKDLPMPKTHEALARLLQRVNRVNKRAFDDTMAGREAPLTSDENWSIDEPLNEFEKEFEHESRNLGVFGVTPKGDRDLRILIEDAAKKFAPELLAVVPQVTKDDIKEAGACLAFERPTACAFHVCRATEALMLAYHEKLTGQPWPPPPMRKVWGVIVDQLVAEGAPKEITNRLKELREDRNSYAHPDVSVPLDEAPIVYEICTGSIFYMAKEMV